MIPATYKVKISHDGHVTVVTVQPYYTHATFNTVIIASFPGPAQFSVTCNMESLYVGGEPGNGARCKPSHLVVMCSHM